MTEKINFAKDYVLREIAYKKEHGEDSNIEEAINDASNIYSDTIEQYCEIYKALIKEF